MNKYFPLIGIVALAGIGALMTQNYLSDPLATERVQLARDLKQIPKEEPLPEPEEPPYQEWHDAIMSRSAVWDALIAPPPPPPPPPPVVPKCPDIYELLDGVRPTKTQMGKKKIKLVTPDNAKGSFVAVGDKVKGCTLESFDRKQATFSYQCPPPSDERQEAVLNIE